jgi:hypothetical protein
MLLRSSNARWADALCSSNEVNVEHSIFANKEVTMNKHIQFWLTWVVSNAVGITLGVFLADLISSLNDIAYAVSFSVIGIVVATFQWLVIRQLLSQSISWPVATIVGWTAIGIIDAALELNPDMMLFLTGALLGAIQWFVLRKESTKAAWWIPASIVGWVFVGTLTRGNFLELFIDAAVGGTITGLALVAVFKSKLQLQEPRRFILVSTTIALSFIVIALVVNMLAIRLTPLPEPTGPVMRFALTSRGNGCGTQEMNVPDGDPISYVFSRWAHDFLGTPILNNFANACNTHDRCYGTLGASKKRCDDEFEDNLYDACKNTYGFGLGKWVAYADPYY